MGRNQLALETTPLTTIALTHSRGKMNGHFCCTTMDLDIVLNRGMKVLTQTCYLDFDN